MRRRKLRKTEEDKEKDGEKKEKDGRRKMLGLDVSVSFFLNFYPYFSQFHSTGLNL